MKIELDIVKILAVGYEKRFMCINVKTKNGNYNKYVRINNDIYQILKQKGIPTAQSLRKKNDENIQRKRSKQNNTQLHRTIIK